MKKFLTFIGCIVIAVALLIGGAICLAGIPDKIGSELIKQYYLHLGVGLALLFSSIGVAIFAIASFFSSKVKIKEKND